jgi:hypothetical protein
MTDNSPVGELSGAEKLVWDQIMLERRQAADTRARRRTAAHVMAIDRQERQAFDEAEDKRQRGIELWVEAYERSHSHERER